MRHVSGQWFVTRRVALIDFKPHRVAAVRDAVDMATEIQRTKLTGREPEGFHSSLMWV